MKITIDTETKIIAAPAKFFEDHAKFVEMAKLTGGNAISLEEYMDNIYQQCRQIKNQKDVAKKTRSRTSAKTVHVNAEDVIVKH